MVFALLGHLHLHTQQLDGNNSMCGPYSNDCSGIKDYQGAAVRPQMDNSYFDSFLKSPTGQVSSHMAHGSTAVDWTGVTSKNAAQFFAHHAPPSAPIDTSTKDANIPINLSGHPLPFQDQSGMTAAQKQATAMTTVSEAVDKHLVIHAAINHSSAAMEKSHFASQETRVPGERDGYASNKWHGEVNAGNEAAYLLFKGSGIKPGETPFAWAAEDQNGIKCPGWCPFAPPPRTQTMNPLYASA